MRRVVIHNHFTRDTVSGSIKIALIKALQIDPLKYFVGVKSIAIVPDKDQWNAEYDFDDDKIRLQLKFENKTLQEKTQILLHEAGHRGQVKDPEAYKAFKARGLGSVKNFLAMANKVHREDYAKNGIDNPDEEAFAESYARFALGLEMPKDIKAFWEERARR